MWRIFFLSSHQEKARNVTFLCHLASLDLTLSNEKRKHDWGSREPFLSRWNRFWIAFVFLIVIGMQRANASERERRIEKNVIYGNVDGFSIARHSFQKLQPYYYVKSRLHFALGIICANVGGKTIWRLTSFLVSFLLYAAWLLLLLLLDCWERENHWEKGSRSTCGRISLWISCAVMDFRNDETPDCWFFMRESRELSTRSYNQSVTTNDDSK